MIIYTIRVLKYFIVVFNDDEKDFKLFKLYRNVSEDDKELINGLELSTTGNILLEMNYSKNNSRIIWEELLQRNWTDYTPIQLENMSISPQEIII